MSLLRTYLCVGALSLHLLFLVAGMMLGALCLSARFAWPATLGHLCFPVSSVGALHCTCLLLMLCFDWCKRLYVCFWPGYYVRGSAYNLQAPAAPFAAGIKHSDQQLQSGLLQYGQPLRPNANIWTYNLQRVSCPFCSLKQNSCVCQASVFG